MPAPASFKKLRRDAPPLAIETPPSFVQYAPPSFILDALLSDRMPQVLRQVRYCGLMSMMKRGTCGKVRRQVPFAVMRGTAEPPGPDGASLYDEHFEHRRKISRAICGQA